MKYGECPYLQERGVTLSNDTLCTTWYYLDNLKKVKNTHGVVLLLVKLQVYACNFTKVTIPHACFSRFLTFTNDTNLHKASQILTRNSNLKLKLYLSLITNFVLKTKHQICWPGKRVNYIFFSGFRNHSLGPFSNLFAFFKSLCFAQKEPLEVFCKKKVFLGISQNSLF